MTDMIKGVLGFLHGRIACFHQFDRHGHGRETAMLFKSFPKFVG
jgi:hypothetical protein